MGKVKADRAAEATQNLIAMFESGDLPEAIAETLIARDQSEAPSAKWSLGNQLLQLLAGTKDARGFKQWDKVNRKVKKGAKALYILGPITVKIKDDDGTERTFIRGFKGIPVFAVEDTEGEPVEVPDYTPMQLPPLMERAEELGVSVDYRPYVGGFRGFYAPSLDHICLVTHDISTFFHELAHAAHARIEPLKNGQDARQEIVAEAVAGVLCLMYGVEGYAAKNHEYIAHYAGEHKNPAKAVLSVLTTVQKVLDLILHDGEED